VDRSEVAVRRQRLDRALADLAGLLREVDEVHWASWLEIDRTRIAVGDAYGLTHLLAAFGGMGSLNDLTVHPVNGHAIAEGEVEGVNARLSTFREAVFRDATAIQRAHEDDVPG